VGVGHVQVVGFDQVVVVEAQQGAVGDVGAAAAGPGAGVVGLAQHGWGGAVGEDAVAVAGDDGPALGGGEDPVGPPVVEDLVVGAGDDPVGIGGGGHAPTH